jgi:hypothetical protein
MNLSLTSFRILSLILISLCLNFRISRAINVKNFGAKGDGVTDDTEAIKAAIVGAVDGIVKFPRGSYRITRTIDVFLSESGSLGLSGKGVSARIIMAGKGPAFRFSGSHTGTADPASIKPITWERERMPLVDELEIVGDNPEADGLEFRLTIMPVLKSLMIRNVYHGIHFTSRNRNAIIDGCHVYNCSGSGIYLDSVSFHQIIISNNHISFCKLGGIKIGKSEIRNLQITGNDIEYNYDLNRPVSADIWIDCSQQGSVREGTISGNTIQAIPSPGGANIRFIGPVGNSDQIGLWSITGNHISNQTVNIYLDHTRGISITGNTFIRGYDRHLIIKDSRNVIVSANVFDHNEDYFPGTLSSLGGISIIFGRSIILSENIIDGAEYGNAETGGAITISESREIAISGCQIYNPKFRGIQINSSVNVRVTDCIVNEDESNLRMLAGMELMGECPGTVIRDNNIGHGKKGNIVNHATGVILESNISINLVPTLKKKQMAY